MYVQEQITLNKVTIDDSDMFEYANIFNDHNVRDYIYNRGNKAFQLMHSIQVLVLKFYFKAYFK